MKKSRQEKILEIIGQYEIDTQEGILEKLHEAGFGVTQATVSRDIKRLNLVKKLTNGKYVYACQEEKAKAGSGVRFQSMLNETVVSLDRAMNIVVVKCHVGMANAVCAAFDSMEWDDVVGTLAGDDTIFVLLRSEQRAQEFMKEIEELLDR